MSDRDWRYWWSLPGPSAFVRSVADDLRRGANLVIGLPRWGPDGLAQAVAAELCDDDLLSWRPLPMESETQDDPLGLLVRRYAPDVAQPTLRDPADLVGSDAFAGSLVWVTGLEGKSWAAWRRFLERYADTVRRRPAEDRGLLCLMVTGLSPGSFPKEDVALSVRLWCDAVSELDMLAWLHHLMGCRGTGSTMHRRLQLRHALELAAYDPRLAREAVTQDLKVLAAPAAWLAGVAATRGWSTETVACWEEGTSDRIEGQLVVHPALHALVGGLEGDLGSLVWRAQIAVLFPFLEEERTRCLCEYGSLLRVPHDTGQGAVIRDRRNLEIGHIHHQLFWRAGVRELQRLRLLRDVRNALAHHEALTPELLQAMVDLS